MSPAHIETSVWYCQWFQTELDPSITPASTDADSRIRHPPSVTGKFLPPLVKVVINFQCLKWLKGEELNRTKASVYNTFWSLRAIFGFTFAGRCSNDFKKNLVHEILKQSKIKRRFIVYIAKKSIMICFSKTAEIIKTFERIYSTIIDCIFLLHWHFFNIKLNIIILYTYTFGKGKCWLILTITIFFFHIHCPKPWIPKHIEK